MIKTPTQFKIDYLFTYKLNGVIKTYPIEVRREYTLGDLLGIIGQLTSDFFDTSNSIVLRKMPSDSISDISFPTPIQTMSGLDKTKTSTTG